MDKLSRLVYVITPYAVTYSGVRKGVQVYDATDYNFDTHEHEPLFATTKMAFVAFAAASGVYLWPLNVMRDIHSTEAYLRGYSQRPPRLAIDYLWN